MAKKNWKPKLPKKTLVNYRWFNKFAQVFTAKIFFRTVYWICWYPCPGPDRPGFGYATSQFYWSKALQMFSYVTNQCSFSTYQHTCSWRSHMKYLLRYLWYDAIFEHSVFWPGNTALDTLPPSSYYELFLVLYCITAEMLVYYFVSIRANCWNGKCMKIYCIL